MLQIVVCNWLQLSDRWSIIIVLRLALQIWWDLVLWNWSCYLLLSNMQWIVELLGQTAFYFEKKEICQLVTNVFRSKRMQFTHTINCKLELLAWSLVQLPIISRQTFFRLVAKTGQVRYGVYLPRFTLHRRASCPTNWAWYTCCIHANLIG